MVDRPAVTEAEDVLTLAYDTSDPAQVNTARKKSARVRRGHLDVVASLMDLKQGRAWINDLLVVCHCFQTSFVQGDPHASSFKEGERNIGLRLLADVMAAAPQQYVTMLNEAKGA